MRSAPSALVGVESGICFPQPPTQFVDDTYVFCSSTSGAQNAIDLLQTAEEIILDEVSGNGFEEKAQP